MAEVDDDDFPNDFDGLDFNNVPALQAPTIGNDAPEILARSSAVTQNIGPPPAASPVPSSGSSGVEDMDATFLAAVDALEARALSNMRRADTQSGLPLELIDERSSSSSKRALDSPQGEGTSILNQVREYLMRFPESSSMNRKGKRKAELQDDIDVRGILSGYEAELTCPICCDLLVGAQVANPCGHTCCGECGYGWLAQNQYESTCAVCRSSLSTRKPLFPNFVVDNFVRQHLQALARSGRPEWQEKGFRTIEWNKRVESWKKQADARAAKEKLKEVVRSRRRQTRYYEIDEDFPYLPAWIIDEGVETDESSVARVMPRRGTRTRH